MLVHVKSAQTRMMPHPLLVLLAVLVPPCLVASRRIEPHRLANNTFHHVTALNIDELSETGFASDGTAVSFISTRRTASCLSRRPKRPLTVYVIDTGCRISHEQLVNRTIAFPAPASPFLSGHDDHGHGTHVAARIAGRHFGLAPHARIVCIKALSHLNQGSSIHVVSAIRLAIRLHRKQPERTLGIMCISLGVAAAPGYVDLDRAVTRAAQAGIVPVVAAGNSGRDACQFTPARATGAITVAATRRDGRLASFSNRGRCVTVGAPGVNIWSAVGNADNSYGITSGTSMAAPYVSGIIALIQNEIGSVSNDVIVQTLQIISQKVEGIHVVSAHGFCQWARRHTHFANTLGNQTAMSTSYNMTRHFRRDED